MENNHWRDLDKKLLDEEERIERHKQFLSQDTQEAVEEWDSHIQSMTLPDALTALRGLQEYAEAVAKEREIDLGWIHDLDQ